MKRDTRLAEEIEFKILGYLEEYRLYNPLPQPNSNVLSPAEQVQQEKQVALIKKVEEFFNENPRLMFHPASVELFALIGMEHPLESCLPHLSIEGYATYNKSLLVRRMKKLKEKIKKGEYDVRDKNSLENLIVKITQLLTNGS